MKVVVLGSGSWGTALALVLKRRVGIDVILWTRNLTVLQDINHNHTNNYLPNCKLPNDLIATTDMRIVRSADLIFLSVPTQQIRDVCQALKEILPYSIPIILCCKGIENKTLKLPSEVVTEILSQNPVLVLSGPSFAVEVAQNLACALTLAGTESLALEIASKLRHNTLFIEHTSNIAITQIGGAVKNVIAIACGIAEGLALGRNMIAAIIARGLHEIYIFSRALDITTTENEIIGMACVGDLVLSCTSSMSRNMRLGLRIGQGENAAAAMLNKHLLSEGIYTVKAVQERTKLLNIKLPLCSYVYDVLYQNGDITQLLHVW